MGFPKRTKANSIPCARPEFASLRAQQGPCDFRDYVRGILAKFILANNDLRDIGDRSRQGVNMPSPSSPASEAVDGYVAETPNPTVSHWVRVETLELFPPRFLLWQNIRRFPGEMLAAVDRDHLPRNAART
jgi:hypothetical protein